MTIDKNCPIAHDHERSHPKIPELLPHRDAALVWN